MSIYLHSLVSLFCVEIVCGGSLHVLADRDLDGPVVWDRLGSGEWWDMRFLYEIRALPHVPLLQHWSSNAVSTDTGTTCEKDPTQILRDFPASSQHNHVLETLNLIPTS